MLFADESCSSTLASTFSNGAKDPNTGVVSTNPKLIDLVACTHNLLIYLEALQYIVL